MVIRHHPSALRNRPHILLQLQRILGASSDSASPSSSSPFPSTSAAAVANSSPSSSAATNNKEKSGILASKRQLRALEIASGSGAHVELFAKHFPFITWQVSEFCPTFSSSSRNSRGTSDCDKGKEVLLELDDLFQTRLSSAKERREVEEGLAEEVSTNCKANSGFLNVLPAIHLDASKPFREWPNEVTQHANEFDLVYVSNVTHISPPEVTVGIIRGASHALRSGKRRKAADKGTSGEKAIDENEEKRKKEGAKDGDGGGPCPPDLERGGLLVIYGPFTVDGGRFTTPSNKDFHMSLRARDPRWGYRDVTWLQALGREAGLTLECRIDMPANNFLLVFQKD